MEPVRLLGPDELRLVADALDEDDAFAFASACRAFRAATCQSGSDAARFPDGIRTTLAGLWATAARLEWAVGAGYRMTAHHMGWAARAGRLEAIKWARAHGCQWDAGTCDSAARGGHLEVLQCGCASGCEWDQGTCASAAG